MHQDTPSRVVTESLVACVRDASTMQRLYRIAEHHGRLRRDSFLSRELVADVIGDIYAGDAKCDPASEMAPQLERYVRRRARRLFRSSRPGGTRRGLPRPELVPLDEASAVAGEPLYAPELHGEDAADDPTDVIARVHELAGNDVQVQQLLALYERGIVARRDVLRAGMTAWVYRVARDRLMRYGAMAQGKQQPDPRGDDGADSAMSPPPGGALSGTARVRGAVRRALGGRQNLHSV